MAKWKTQENWLATGGNAERGSQASVHQIYIRVYQGRVNADGASHDGFYSVYLEKIKLI